MPYDKDGKYYRKPVYRVQKTKKVFPLKKKRHINFYLFGIISPYIYLVLYVLSGEYIRKFMQLDEHVELGLSFVILPIFFLILIFIIGEIQIRKYINWGGKLSKIKIYGLATIWWALNTPIIVIVFFVFFLAPFNLSNWNLDLNNFKK